MFISEKEAQRRLKSIKNLSNSLNFSGAPGKNGSVAATSGPVSYRTEAVNAGTFATSHTPVISGIPSGIPQENISKENNDKLKIIAKSLATQGVADSAISAELNIPKSDILSSDKEVSARMRAGVDRIHDLAINRMMIALGLMTQDKFEDAILRDLNGSISALSKVIDQTRPKDEDEKIGVQFIVHAPESKKLKQYSIIDV